MRGHCAAGQRRTIWSRTTFLNVQSNLEDAPRVPRRYSGYKVTKSPASNDSRAFTFVTLSLSKVSDDRRPGRPHAGAAANRA